MALVSNLNVVLGAMACMFQNHHNKVHFLYLKYLYIPAELPGYGLAEAHFTGIEWALGAHF